MSEIKLDDFLQFITPNRLNRMKEVLKERTRYLTVVMENLYNPQNTSAVIRSSEAFGLQDLHIIELENQFNISRKVSQGSHNWINLYKHQSTESAVKNLHDKGYKVYFADPRPEYPDLEDLPLDQKTAVVFGQEKQGITPEMKKLADGGFRIPLYGFVESFNVSVACAITISRLIARLRKNPPKDFLLNEEEKNALFSHWLIKNTLVGNALKKTSKHKNFLLEDPELFSI